MTLNTTLRTINSVIWFGSDTSKTNQISLLELNFSRMRYSKTDRHDFSIPIVPHLSVLLCPPRYQTAAGTL